MSTRPEPPPEGATPITCRSCGRSLGAVWTSPGDGTLHVHGLRPGSALRAVFVGLDEIAFEHSEHCVRDL
jgi:hypothetical protein